MSLAQNCKFRRVASHQWSSLLECAQEQVLQWLADRHQQGDSPIALYQILPDYPRYLWAHAMRPYGLAFWESGLCNSDLVLALCR